MPTTSNKLVEMCAADDNFKTLVVEFCLDEEKLMDYIKFTIAIKIFCRLNNFKDIQTKTNGCTLQSSKIFYRTNSFSFYHKPTNRDDQGHISNAIGLQQSATETPARKLVIAYSNS